VIGFRFSVLRHPTPRDQQSPLNTKQSNLETEISDRESTVAMPSATASGSDAKGGASSRDHNQGNQNRSYTPEQKAAVLRIRKCQATAFYEILSVERSSTDNEIKKAYRKQSLLTHPDKNGYEGADEAFKSE
jgi:DnaJ-domain-containing protein 1